LARCAIDLDQLFCAQLFLCLRHGYRQQFNINSPEVMMKEANTKSDQSYTSIVWSLTLLTLLAVVAGLATTKLAISLTDMPTDVNASLESEWSAHATRNHAATYRQK
jgi:hypothetical protein